MFSYQFCPRLTDSRARMATYNPADPSPKNGPHSLDATPPVHPASSFCSKPTQQSQRKQSSGATDRAPALSSAETARETCALGKGARWGRESPRAGAGAHLLEAAGGVHADHGAGPQPPALVQPQTHQVGRAVGGRADQDPTVRQSVEHLHPGHAGGRGGGAPAPCPCPRGLSPGSPTA